MPNLDPEKNRGKKLPKYEPTKCTSYLYTWVVVAEPLLHVHTGEVVLLLVGILDK